MRRRYSREQWQKWIAEQEQSGLSITEFCRLNGASEKCFYRWRKKLVGESKGAQAARQESNPPFVPLTISGSTDEVEIALPCGATVRVRHDGPALQHVLKTLLEIGRTT